jgi:hypothetical protein
VEQQQQEESERAREKPRPFVTFFNTNSTSGLPELKMFFSGEKKNIAQILHNPSKVYHMLCHIVNGSKHRVIKVQTENR